MSNGITRLRRTTGKTIFAVIMTVVCLRAQNESTRSEETTSTLFIEAVSSASDQPGKGHIDIYIQIPYPEIHFVKEGEQYTGRFEISAAILSQEKQQLWQNSQLVELHLNNFSQTTSDRFSNLRQFSTNIAPGKYELVLQVSDQESKKIATVKRSIIVKNFENDTLGLSDLMLVRRMTIDGTRKNIVPILSGVISKEQKSLYRNLQSCSDRFSDAAVQVYKLKTRTRGGANKKRTACRSPNTSDLATRHALYGCRAVFTCTRSHWHFKS